MKKIKIALIQHSVKPYAFKDNLEILSLKLAPLKKQGIGFETWKSHFQVG